MKIKQESSGWPTECVTDVQKAEYVREYEAREGVKLDPTSITKNPGRRQVAKLALNSFWGRCVIIIIFTFDFLPLCTFYFLNIIFSFKCYRWGMNLNKTQLTYILTLEQFNKKMSDPRKNVSNIFSHNLFYVFMCGQQ